MHNTNLNVLALVLAFIMTSLVWLACNDNRSSKEQLRTVSVKEFAEFVEATGYITDAERFGWSVKQITVYEFEVLDSLTWRKPDGVLPPKAGYAVTQVSYTDALAYAQWSKTRIPSYEEYWQLVKLDDRLINESSAGILPIDQVNIVGNVWDITTPDPLGRIRLAGGSYLCNKNTCNGTSPDRELYVDAATGNTHIGFSVIESMTK